MLTNFATRAHNHNYPFDPIIRSLLDTDFYKLLMLQFIWKNYRKLRVKFKLINRSKTVRIADEVDERALRQQLDHVRGLRFQRTELVWLAGETFYGTRNIFEPAFIEWLGTFSLPDYDLRRVDGQYELTFRGPWAKVTLWEIYALSIVNELRTRAALAKMSETELDILYARAKAKLWDKIERLRATPGVKVADFGTRRRHSHLWQAYVVRLMKDELPGTFTGTSNAYLAFTNNLEAIGTNAHELPMALAAIAALASDLGVGEEGVRRQWEEMFGPVLSSGDLKGAQYEVLRQWAETYGGAMRVMLPDTFGTTQFLEDAPDFVYDFTGQRVDSKDPDVAAEEYIAWLEGRGIDPRDRLLLFSDGLDVGDIIRLHGTFSGRIRVAFGWGTLLTNDFRGCHPRGLPDLDPISLVCKVAEVGVPLGADVPDDVLDGPLVRWIAAVKLSDNYTKATGPEGEVARYRGTFGTRGVANAPVTV